MKLKRRKTTEASILVAVEVPGNSTYFNEMLSEMLQLLYSAGSKVVDTLVQKRSGYDPATLIGKGKVDELQEMVEHKKPDLIVFMNDLKPSQERNLSQKLKVKIIDRQALILDIFAQRARTREGKMQVELALLNYLLPRLAGLGGVLSRLGGGIGTRGPGETMLETDRRHVRRRIQTLKSDLEKLMEHRELLRDSRYNRGFLTAALVGYTNSGKSTILNLLTSSSVEVKDKLFATLDPTLGKYYLGEGMEILLVDTVGFIRHLPHHLAAAFKATLEEVREADIILQVVDVSNIHWKEHREVTDQVLEEMACDNKPVLLVFNKVDCISELRRRELASDFPQGIQVSALKNLGFDQLSQRLMELTQKNYPDFVRRFSKKTGREWIEKHIAVEGTVSEPGRA